VLTKSHIEVVGAVIDGAYSRRKMFAMGRLP